jgi:hypothetical protein
MMQIFMPQHDDFEEWSLRGWSMRHGHCRRLKCGDGKETRRGRTAFARSVNRGSRQKVEDERDGKQRLQQKRRDSCLHVDACANAGVTKKASWPCVVSSISCMDVEFWESAWDESPCKADENDVICDSTFSEICPRRKGDKIAVARVQQRLAKAARWEEALARAKRTAEEYRVSDKGRRQPLFRAPEVADITFNQQPTDAASKVHPNVRIVGRSPAQEAHDRAHECAKIDMQHCGGAPKDGTLVSLMHLGEDSSEYKAVAEYFCKTVGAAGRDYTIVSVTRAYNPTTYSRYVQSSRKPSHHGREMLMFHGCRTQANENSILSTGFQVSKCTSGGTNFGTWFAYGAAYSDSNYAWDDNDGIRHLFLCIVSDRRVVLDNVTMRVVGQDCAYPLWLLRYRRPIVSRARPVISPPFQCVLPPAKPLISQEVMRFTKSSRTHGSRHGRRVRLWPKV